MLSFEFACPTKIICGEKSLEKIADELRDRHMRKPLVVTDANLVKLGIAQTLFKPLEAAGVPYAVFDRVPPDSSLDIVNEVVGIYHAQGCDGLVALGGGSVIDTSKGAAASISAGDADFTALQGSEILTHDLPPLIAIPTTSGTGSEATLVAVVKDTEANAKLSYTSYRLVPQAAFLDPTLTTSLPPKLTATTGIDAMTHAIEAYTSIQKNPISDALAVSALDILARNLDAACAAPADVDARCNLALGSCMAGASFSNAMVGIVHAIGHSLGGRCRVPHGQAMMMLLPHCVRYNLAHGYHTGMYGELLHALAPERAATCNSDAAALDAAFEQALFDQNNHYHEVYQVPIALSALGIAREQLADVAHHARYDGAALYNEQEITEDMALEILEAAF